MPIAFTPFHGWERNARLFNAHVEIIVTLEVGPRVILYRRLDAPPGDERNANALKNYDAQLGGSGESEWRIRGGHRLWLAPEELDRTYALDNSPVRHEILGPETLLTVNAAAAPWWIEKRLTLTLDATGPGVTLRHEISNRGPEPVTTAPWALTVMPPGGVAILPQPPLGQHPRDLLPNRRLILWPYTDLSDPRWGITARFITLRQTADGLPTKIGLAHAQHWAGYLHGRRFFAKSVPFQPGATYPDEGSNFETFTNHEMLELETLAPLRTFAPGESAEHTERWTLHNFDRAPDPADEAGLAAQLDPILAAAGMS